MTHGRWFIGNRSKRQKAPFRACPFSPQACNDHLLRWFGRELHYHAFFLFIWSEFELIHGMPGAPRGLLWVHLRCVIPRFHLARCASRIRIRRAFSLGAASIPRRVSFARIRLSWQPLLTGAAGQRLAVHQHRLLWAGWPTGRRSPNTGRRTRTSSTPDCASSAAVTSRLRCMRSTRSWGHTCRFAPPIVRCCMPWRAASTTGVACGRSSLWPTNTVGRSQRRAGERQGRGLAARQLGEEGRGAHLRR